MAPRQRHLTFHNGIVEDGSVRYELAADGEHTILTYTHCGLGLNNASGWRPGGDAYLDRLAAHLAGDRLPGWSDRYAELETLYA